MSGYYGIVPPDVAGLGQLTKYLPNRDEFMQAGIAGVGVAGGMIGGLGLERFLKTNITYIPNWAYPIIHGFVGVVGGKLVADYNAPLGVGLASGLLALAILRGLQGWLNLDVSFAGLQGLDADLGDLADLLGDDDADLLPTDLDGLSGVQVDEQVALSGYDGWPAM